MLAQEELVEHEAEVGVAGAGIHQHRLLVPLEHVAQRRLEQLHQVVHLLELAQAVGVQRAVAADQVQLAQELHRLPGQQLAPHLFALRLPHRARHLSQDVVEQGAMLFAVCAPGIEPVLEAEVRALGLRGHAVAGGVEVHGGLPEALRLNLWSRTASRVLLRMGEPFRATAFPELVRKASALPWEEFVRQRQPHRVPGDLPQVAALPLRRGGGAAPGGARVAHRCRAGPCRRRRGGGSGCAALRRAPRPRRLHGQRRLQRRAPAPPGLARPAGQGAAARNAGRGAAARRRLVRRDSALRSALRLGHHRHRGRAIWPCEGPPASRAPSPSSAGPATRPRQWEHVLAQATKQERAAARLASRPPTRTRAPSQQPAKTRRAPASRSRSRSAGSPISRRMPAAA